MGVWKRRNWSISPGKGSCIQLFGCNGLGGRGLSEWGRSDRYFRIFTPEQRGEQEESGTSSVRSCMIHQMEVGHGYPLVALRLALGSMILGKAFYLYLHPCVCKIEFVEVQ